MDFMKNNFKPYSVILSGDYVGAPIPAFIPMKAYYAHVAQTKDYGIKTALVDKFFKGQMGKEEAKDFIRVGNIDYIYVGPLERYLNIDYANVYSLSLKLVYDYDGILIYKIEK